MYVYVIFNMYCYVDIEHVVHIYVLYALDILENV